jgi:hypothetical protein
MPRPGRKRRPVPREPNGRAQRNSKAEQEAIMRTALEARARHAGVTLTADNAKDLAQPWAGSDFGIAIKAEPDGKRVWDFLGRFIETRRNYLSAIDAPPPWPKIAKLGDALAPMSSTDAPRSDPRSAEERAESALRAWDAIHNGLQGQPLAMLYLLQAAEHDDPLAIPDAVRVLRGLGERMGW